ncbi:MAG TPA: bifunctional DNA primase/polymerase [Polyangiaceae bacterium]|jgi:hypothetical protein
MTTMLGLSAMAYARAGFAVFPLAPNGKQPAIARGRGVYDATCDEKQIAAWWLRWPGANIGLAVKPEWLVIDVDVRSGGFETLFSWPSIPVTPTQQTATGGVHYVFQRPSCDVRGKAGKGVDVLQVGRYIVAAPSVIGGKRYEWTIKLSATPIAKLPPWLHANVMRKERQPRAEKKPQEKSAPDIIERARKYLATCEPAITGQRGGTWTFVVAQKLVRGFALDDESAFLLMKEWNRTCQPPWDDYGLRRKIRQARTTGSFDVGGLRDAPRRSA